MGAKNNVARMEYAEIEAHLIDVKIADTPIHCKVYGEEHWDYPDPRCAKAPRNISENIYV